MGNNRANRVATSGRFEPGMSMPVAVPEVAGQKIDGVLQRAYRSGEPQSLPQWRLLLEHEGVPHEMYFSMTILPLRTGGATCAGWPPTVRI